MKKNNVMIATDFEKLVAEHRDGSWECPDVVQGHVHLDGDKMKLDRINISGVTFTGMLTISDFKSKKHGIVIGTNCNLLDGLIIEAVDCVYISLVGCKAKHVSLWRCNLEFSEIITTEVQGDLDVSGLNLSDKLRMMSVGFTSLSLSRSNTSGTIRVPKVITNELLIAEHFRLAQVPVFLPTPVIKGLIK